MAWINMGIKDKYMKLNENDNVEILTPIGTKLNGIVIKRTIDIITKLEIRREDGYIHHFKRINDGQLLYHDSSNWIPTSLTLKKKG